MSGAGSGTETGLELGRGRERRAKKRRNRQWVRCVKEWQEVEVCEMGLGGGERENGKTGESMCRAWEITETPWSATVFGLITRTGKQAKRRSGEQGQSCRPRRS